MTTAASTGATPQPSSRLTSHPAPVSTRIEVSGSEVAALGVALSHVATDLQWHAAEVADRGWALGVGHSTAALGDVLGDFEHRRLVLGRALDDLAVAARRAGGLYVEVEAAVGGMVDAGQTT
ncbi:hypothetical protein [Pedococcus soli]